jgi:ferritin-like metal-binding protein YciE
MRAFAEALGMKAAAEMIDAALDEENAADEKPSSAALDQMSAVARSASGQADRS